MRDQRFVLVVDADSADLASTAMLLEAAGYRVLSAGSFDEAKQVLALEGPDLLITGVRLGPYNGLHLVLRSRSDHPEMAAIVTSRHRDAVLEQEARRQNAGFVVRPVADDEFLAEVSRSLARTLHAPPAPAADFSAPAS
jgi:DNA-binding NtrC family response regulator